MKRRWLLLAGVMGSVVLAAVMLRGRRPIAAPEIHEPPVLPFKASGTGADATVFDKERSLTWQQQVPSRQFFSWDGTGKSPRSAQYYCEHLNLAGHTSGWRLPTLKELLSIVDNSQRHPAAYREFFPQTPPNGYFWTADAAGTGAAWYVYFNNGHAYVNDAGYRYSVRCVR